MLEGILVFLILAAAGTAGEVLVIDRLRDTRVDDWLADHVYLPALRMPALIGFVLASYPGVYGLDAGPPLSSLLDFDTFGRALNILFVLPLLFSLLPLAGHLSALVLPLQGVALTALLFLPLEAVAGTGSARYWPDATTCLALLIFGMGGHLLGSAIAERLPRRRQALPAYDAVILLCQAPAILVYGRMLGRQLA